MKRASQRAIVVAVLCFISIWVVMTARMAAVSLTEEVRVLGLMVLPTATVAGLLVVYFEWRAQLLNRIRDRRHEGRNAA